MIRQTVSLPAAEDEAPVPLAELSRRLRAGREFSPLGWGQAAWAEVGFQARSLMPTAPLAPPPAPVDAASHPTAIARALVQPPSAPDAPAPVPAVLPELLDAARAEGYRDGLVQGEAQGFERGWTEGEAAGREAGGREGRLRAEADLSHARRLFETAAARLSDPDGSDLGHLAAALHRAVGQLASERAGLAIDGHPAAFTARIARLADRIGQGLRQVSVHLNPADLAALTGHLTGAVLSPDQLVADPALHRGDVEVRAEGVTLSDLLLAIESERGT